MQSKGKCTVSKEWRATKAYPFPFRHSGSCHQVVEKLYLRPQCFLLLLHCDFEYLLQLGAYFLVTLLASL